MKKIIVPSLLAAAAVFIWTAISWMLLGWHEVDMKGITSTELAKQIQTELTEPGIYIYPGYSETGEALEMEEWNELRKAGPMIHFMVYDPEGAEWNMGESMIKSFIINFISAFIAAVLLMMTLAQNPSFMRRVIFVMLLGLFAGFVVHFMNWNWWNMATGFTIVNVIDVCVTWFIGGLILAWRIKPDLKTA
ncbi:MAG: hypothetical protein HKM87_06970 [Ignavibacteriaceae bacterium]|nr:hypothetical protein [Ignavibacteriaceae bacterium]